MIDSILSSREQKLIQIQNLLQSHELVISVKSNIPGSNKNISEAYLLVRLFHVELSKMLIFKKPSMTESADGPYFLIPIKHSDPKEMKMMMISIENTHPLGRFIDLDVHQHSDASISREDLGVPPRKCYLCEHDAHFCSRNQTHDIQDLVTYVKENVSAYLNDQILSMIDQAILTELELDDKFGLVSKTSSGSHEDMDYHLMLKAKEIIVPYLLRLFMKGYESFELAHLLEESRPLGIEAELEMLKATNGINCYKGLIFMLGLTVISSGYALSHNQKFHEIFTNISVMTKDIFKEFDMKPKTFGMEAYRTHQIKGARGEAYLGLPSVQIALKELLHLSKLNDIALRVALKELIL
ncbi:MAG TPA: citrate lyase holo-[acyl-carrier protein] synthase, partial [Acholeplasmataceae bacterium]|nr:citrate lyase holo-[acyl-carrier protein] synthase [Acholeplasmataceae bacterium]